MNTMKALVKDKDTVLVREMPSPTLQSDHEVIIQVERAGLCRTDVYVAEGRIAAPDPLILGHEFAGVIRVLGDQVATLRVGDRVTVNPLLACGLCPTCLAGNALSCQHSRFLGVHQHGAFAEYIAVPAMAVYPLPDGVTFTQGAYTEPVAASLATLEVSTLRMLPAFVLTGAGVACLNPVLATATVSTLPASRIGDATSLYALMRWIGGNMGFALVGTQVIHRTAVHEQALTSYTTLEAIGVTSGLRNLTDYFTNQGFSLPLTEVYAMKFMHQIVDNQASMLAYRDIFAVLALLFLCGSPLLWLLGRHRRNKQAFP